MTDFDATELAQQRLDEARARFDLDVTLAHTRASVESLLATASDLETSLPETVGDAVRQGVREQAQPLGRQVAELRGLTNRMIRQLERIEHDLAAERHARVDDLALVLDLLISGWRSLEERLRSIDARTDGIEAWGPTADERLSHVDDTLLQIVSALSRSGSGAESTGAGSLHRFEQRNIGS